MYNSPYDIRSLIILTENLMKRNEIPIRDTWDNYDGKNFDDYYINGNSYDKQKLINVILKDEGITEMKAEGFYTIYNFKHLAYNNSQIFIPKRLYPLKHPIVHEIVHFLQENTAQRDKEYITFNGKNYTEYISQRSELEAHFIQIKYLCEQEEYIEPRTNEQLHLLKEFESQAFNTEPELIENIINIKLSRLI